MMEHRPSTVPSADVVIWTFGWIIELDRSVSGPPCDKTSFVSLAQILFVCNRNFGSGNETFEGDDFVGDALDLFTGLFVGDGNFTSIIINKGIPRLVFNIQIIYIEHVLNASGSGLWLVKPNLGFKSRYIYCKIDLISFRAEIARFRRAVAPSESGYHSDHRPTTRSGPQGLDFTERVPAEPTHT